MKILLFKVIFNKLDGKKSSFAGIFLNSIDDHIQNLIVLTIAGMGFDRIDQSQKLPFYIADFFIDKDVFSITPKTLIIDDEAHRIVWIGKRDNLKIGSSVSF